MRDWKRMLLRVLLFALLGLLFEVFFTDLGAMLRGKIGRHGNTSLLMMLDYGLLGLVVGPIAEALKRRRIPLALRAVVYMVGIFFIEYVSGRLFTAAGWDIWNYSGQKWNLHGQITLMYAPFWYFLGLWVEFLYRRVDACAAVILRGLTADQVMAVEKTEARSCGGGGCCGE
ncbi:MAG: hypothetical protein GX580_11675 [Candidatus Hydrogenedens sp.]|nr:hypothetical protein [Candidatus Hydrogenedentota bacterium]NLF58285.1 hypothetical protein [Candidatus Hydrogenedens sp.]